MDKSCEFIVSSKDSGFSNLNDDILSMIFIMLFAYNDFTRCHQSISINKQFYRIVLNIIPILPEINFYSTTFKFLKNNELEKILRETKNITTLKLKGIIYDYNLVESIATYLERNSTLTTLDLSYNGCIRMDLSYNGCIRMDIKKIAQALKSNSTLTELNLKKTRFYTIDIVEVLKINTTLTILNLSYTGICGEMLAETLKINTTLTTLDLSYTGIYGEMLAEAMKINTTLRTLYVNNNMIDSPGMTAIAEALKYSKLTTIDISYNNVGHNTAKAIAESLNTNTTLTTFMLNNTRMHSSEIVVIAKALQINQTLTIIDISYNDLGYHGTKAIAETIEINTTLTILNFSYCNINDDGAKLIEKALEINTTISVFF
jgi:Ran GTPase-activating protein (RanGAP) involved in mRNA processing and transport